MLSPINHFNTEKQIYYEILYEQKIDLLSSSVGPSNEGRFEGSERIVYANKYFEAA
jgi:hypothetical protein